MEVLYMGAVTIVLLNQKGGVGKTSTTHHLAGTLSQMGKRVLLIDNDPQASLTQGLWGPTVTRGLEPETTVWAVYAQGAPPEQVTHTTTLPGVDLVPGCRLNTKFNNGDPQAEPYEYQSALRELVAATTNNYDLILIDCPPNLHLCSWAALAAADHIVIPLQPEDYGAQGIIDVQESIEAVRAVINPSLGLLGYVITMFEPRKSVHQYYETTLREAYGEAVFTAKVPRLADFPEAILRRQAVAQFKPRGASAKAVKALADELLSRVDAARRGVQVEAA
jgi:chromosome partitioning protein